jgi:hypothetical protein
VPRGGGDIQERHRAGRRPRPRRLRQERRARTIPSGNRSGRTACIE